MSNPSVKPQGRPRSEGAGYEKRDANAKWIFGLISFLLIAGLIMHFCLASVMERLEKKPFPNDTLTGTRRGAAAVAESKAVPQLQLVPAEELKQFHAREEIELNTYGWIDRTAGVVRLPIDRAMDLVLERGLPVRSQSNAGALGPSAYQLQQQRPQYPQPEIQGAK
jgi:hypothetical protein